MNDADPIARQIVDAAVNLHIRLGPGLLESVYEVLLARQLENRGLTVERQKSIDITIDGLTFEGGFRLDLLVNNLVIVEVKSIEKLALVHTKQVLTYLNLMNVPIGLLLNFGAATMKEGIRRVVSPQYLRNLVS